MEKFISKNFLNIERASEFEKSILLVEKKLVNIELSLEGKKYDIFLSHKHSDKELVFQFKKLIDSLNLDIYIDWLDDEMPITTDKETALKLKEKIKTSRKFVLLATDEAINSKWCNWELGYGDAYKYFENIAILPISNTDDGNWTGNEYLKTYPAITYTKNNNNESIELFVEFLGKKESFISWLKK